MRRTCWKCLAVEFEIPDGHYEPIDLLCNQCYKEFLGGRTRLTRQ